MKNEQAEILRKRYKYRQLILSRKIKLPIEIAKKLIGPDTAYHLYSSVNNEDDDKDINDKENRDE